MSEELKIELQVEAETSAAKTKVDNLINELKNKATSVGHMAMDHVISLLVNSPKE